ncbi:MAG: LLM class flavin-dependent oxidoreductase [Anaerolineae bacterium]|nr:LLM class flavin-dependent oxidoreductase [Anaerolineae bacterium]
MPQPALGVIFHPTFPPETLVDYARRAESAGFDELWLWEDCFFAGAYTSAATALAATERLKVGIGLSPATLRNPLLMAMEITTLARLYPQRFMPGFGHGVDGWMRQIGAAPKSSMKALEETVTAIRGLLHGETVTMQGDHVHMDNVKMQLTAPHIPPLYVGAIREKSLRLAGRVGDGTIITDMSSPAYVRWVRQQIATGMAEAGRTDNRLVVFVQSKVNPDGKAARERVRHVLAVGFQWGETHLRPLGIAEEAQALHRAHGVEGTAQRMPEAWLDELSASGTPEQAAAAIQRLADAGADTVALQPLDGDPACLDEYSRYLLPLLKA